MNQIRSLAEPMRFRYRSSAFRSRPSGSSPKGRTQPSWGISWWISRYSAPLTVFGQNCGGKHDEYVLNAKKYLFLKYVLSFILTVISFVNYKSLKNSIIYCLVSFFTPNYLINRFKKKEDSMFIEEVRCLTNSIILTLSAYGTLEQALTIAKVSLKNTRFIDEYDKFIYEYKMTGFNLKEASKNLTKRFSSYELSLFVSTLIQGDIEGNLLENMKKFSETLELNYFKYLKKKSQERLIYVTLGTVISLLNIVMIVMYPMLTQILNNLQIIFS